MRVKHNGTRWEVTQFVEEHKHEFIEKFSLKKYLRSHNKIPKEERKFIDMLHDVSINSGRIMKIMGEIYGSKKDIPSSSKMISNYTATIDGSKRIRHIPELLAYFEEI
jgi:hypothetical protein